MNIVLIGYRGCGKTTIGQTLAEQLWKTFVDVDLATRGRFGNRTIAEIWSTEGEPAWREAEVQVTRDLCAGDEQVIALGGGTLMQPEARRAVEAAEDCRRIYLACHPEELQRRMRADAETAGSRPSLTGGGGAGDDLDEIRAVLRERDPVYREVADAVLDVTHVAPDDAVRHLIRRCL